MENLIDKNYFWGGIALPNMSEEEEQSELDRYIAYYQKDYLKKMFGDAIAENVPVELIDELRDEETLFSPIADYVYFHHNMDKATVTAPAGEKTIVIQNTQTVTPNEKLVRAWNRMVDFNHKLHDKLYLGTIEIEGISYVDDIQPNIDLTDDIFCSINIFNI